MSDAVPTEHENPPLRRQASLVLVHTGDGKGKSSSAFGVVIRAVARDWPVAVVQFLKSGNWQVGEEKVCRDRLGVDWWAIGEGFTWESDDLTEDQAVAVEAWQHARRLIETGAHQLVVLDEITYPMNWSWIETPDVTAAIAARPPHVNIIATGRDAPPELIEIADTVTDMKSVKHAYEQGIRARRGIDY